MAHVENEHCTFVQLEQARNWCVGLSEVAGKTEPEQEREQRPESVLRLHVTEVLQRRIQGK
jgi:hypothetical protein